jgi:hypothetical protein
MFIPYATSRTAHVLARLQQPYRLFEFVPAFRALKSDHMSANADHRGMPSVQTPGSTCTFVAPRKCASHKQQREIGPQSAGRTKKPVRTSRRSGKKRRPPTCRIFLLPPKCPELSAAMATRADLYADRPGSTQPRLDRGAPLRCFGSRDRVRRHSAPGHARGAPPNAHAAMASGRTGRRLRTL